TPKRLGIELLSEGSRSRHVGEDERDRLPHLAGRARRDDLRRAGVAEARSVGILVPAHRAGRHAASLRRYELEGTGSRLSTPTSGMRRPITSGSNRPAPTSSEDAAPAATALRRASSGDASSTRAA